MNVERLRQVRNLLAPIVQWTETKVDDRALELLDLIIDSPDLVEWFLELMNLNPNAQVQALVSPEAEALRGRFDFRLLAELLPIIRELWALFR